MSEKNEKPPRPRSTLKFGQPVRPQEPAQTPASPEPLMKDAPAPNEKKKIG